MPQRHLDRLSPIDAGFLLQEDRSPAHMHIGGVAILDGPPPTLAEALRHVESRLHLIPRYRQKVAQPPLQTGRAVWVDDPCFRLEYHVRDTALPRPGGEAELRRLAARIFSQRLDRTRPLWELWFVEGLSDDRFAIISKTHHALIDGVAGVDILTALLDLTPEVQQHAEPEPWEPQPTPGGAELAARSAVAISRRTLGTAAAAVRALSRPTAVPSAVLAAAQGIGELADKTLRPTPKMPWNVPAGPHRRLETVRTSLDDIKRIRRALGGTVNDVVLAVVAGAIARYLPERGVDPTGLELRAQVPISLRSEAAKGALGNEISVFVVPLPVGIADPVQRLRHVSAEMQRIKSSNQLAAARVITEMERFAPSTLLAQATALPFSSRLHNLLVTNVPGPQFPIYLLGRQLQELFPIPFLTSEHSLSIAVMSYLGSVSFGLLGDFDAMPDLAALSAAIDDSLAELMAAAAAAAPDVVSAQA